MMQVMVAGQQTIVYSKGKEGGYVKPVSNGKS